MKKLYLFTGTFLISGLSLSGQNSAEQLQERVVELESLVSILQSKLEEVDLLNFILLAITGAVFFLIFLVMNFSFRRRVSRELNAIKRQLMGSLREHISPIISDDDNGVGEQRERIAEYDRKLKELSVSERDFSSMDWIIRGLDNYYTGEFERALKAYGEAVKKGHSLAEGHYGKGMVLMAMGRPDEGEPEFRLTLELKADFAECWFALGEALEQLEKSEEAVESFRKAVELRPEYPAAYRKLGMDLRKLERKEEAVQTYNRMGDTLIRMGREEEAVEAYRNMAVDLIKLGQSDEKSGAGHGRVDLEILEREQEALDSYYAMGSKFSELGRNEEALDAYEEILKIKPEDREAQFCKARVLTRLGRYEESGESLRDLVDSAPANVKAWYLFGKVLSKLGKEEEAVEAFNTVARLKPDHPDTYQKLAAFHADKGNKKEALENLERYLELTPVDARRLEKFHGIETLKKDPAYLELVNRHSAAAGM